MSGGKRNLLRRRNGLAGRITTAFKPKGYIAGACTGNAEKGLYFSVPAVDFRRLKTSWREIAYGGFET